MTDIIERSAPSGVDVRNLQTELQRVWGPAFARDQRMRDLVNRKNKIELLPLTDDLSIVPMEIHSGRAGSILDHAQSFVGTLPSLLIEPLEPTTEARRDVEQTERALKSLFHKQLVDNGFWNNLGRGMLLTGRGVLICMPLTAAWTVQAGFPVRKKGQRVQAYLDEVNTWKHDTGEIPIIIRAIPPDKILLKLDNNDKVLVSLETKLVEARVVAEELQSAEVQELLDQKRLQWYDQLEVIQYIDDTWVCYFLVSTSPVREGLEHDLNLPRGYKKLKAWKHGLGKNPVVFVPGVKTDEQELELRFKPFLADAEEDLVAFDFLLSRLGTMVNAFYFPNFQWQLGVASTSLTPGQERPDEHINLGGTTTTFNDEVISPISPPNNLPDATMLKDELDRLIQQTTLEDVLFGRVQGSSAAFAIRLRINVAKNKLVPHVQHMAMGLTEIYDLVTRSIEWLNTEVVIDGEEITPKMAIAARGRIAVSIDPRLPGEEGIDLQKAAMAMNLRLPEPWIWETILGIDDPASLALMRDISELEERPEIKERLMQEALEMLQVQIEDEETMAILDVLDQFGDQLDPEVIAALQALATGQTTTESTEGAPPPPEGGLGRGPSPEGSSPQAVGGGRGLGTVNSPRPANTMEEGDSAAVGTEA